MGRRFNQAFVLLNSSLSKVQGIGVAENREFIGAAKYMRHEVKVLAVDGLAGCAD